MHIGVGFEFFSACWLKVGIYFLEYDLKLQIFLKLWPKIKILLAFWPMVETFFNNWLEIEVMYQYDPFDIPYFTLRPSLNTYRNIRIHACIKCRKCPTKYWGLLSINHSCVQNHLYVDLTSYASPIKQ
jgi:hypothetical protein